MNLTETQQQMVVKLQKRMLDTMEWQCCLNCANFDSQDKTCTIAGAAPPLEIIVIGCKQWLADVPF